MDKKEQEFLDNLLKQSPTISKMKPSLEEAGRVIRKGRVKEREWNTVADIFQRAIKRNKLTEEQVLQQCKEILKEVREERK